MKKILALILAFALFSNVAMADCDWQKDVIPLKDGTFAYSLDCHMLVGKTLEDNHTKDAQIADLNKAITLKDLALTIADQRTQNWMDTSTKMEARLQAVDSLESKNYFLYFGLGILATIGTGFAVARLTR